MFYDRGRQGPPPNFRGGGNFGPPMPHRGRGYNHNQSGGFQPQSSFRDNHGPPPHGFGGRGFGPPRGGFDAGPPRGGFDAGRGRGRGGFGQEGGFNEFNTRGRESNEFQSSNRQSTQNQNYKPWITQDIRVAIGCRNQLAQKAKQSKSGEDFDALSSQKKRVEEMLEVSKNIYFKENPEREEEWLHVLAKESFSSSTWCDVCEKGFESIHKLREHSAEHATCGVDGCSYTAHQSLLEKHIRHQHLSGLFQKIPQGQSREEIEKWRAERKKNFPTQDKVAVKDAERCEARERGEVLRLEKIIRKYSGVKDEEDEKENSRQKGPVEPDWECNCKARFALKGQQQHQQGGHRGRHNFNNRRPNQHVNINRLRHQSHCQELVKIRERIKAKNELKAKERLERQQTIQNLKKEKGDGEEGDTVIDKPRVPDVDDNIDDSESEDEAVNGTLVMFPGTGKSSFHRMSSFSMNDEDITDNGAVDAFNISDDDEDFKPINQSINEPSNDSEQDEPKGDAVNFQENGFDLNNPAEEARSVIKDADQISDSDEYDDSPPEEIQIVKRSQISDGDDLPKEISINKDSPDNDDIDDDGPPDEICISKTDPLESLAAEIDSENPQLPVSNNSGIEMQKGRRKRRHKGDNSDDKNGAKSDQNGAKRFKKPTSVFAKRIAPPTLLERLLSDQILHERNVILQCVRFVCKNEYLQKQED